MTSDSIFLPVSLGEAIDKLTILDIKLARITDSRRDDVLVEYTLLHDKLASYISQYLPLYESMKKVNTTIWDYMDKLRDGSLGGDEYLDLCKKTIEYNDIRFRIKNKINTASGSLLKEQKGYKVNSVLIEINESITAITDLIAPIRYYSCIYDQVVIRYTGLLEISQIFSDDPSIVVTRSVDGATSFKKHFVIANSSSREEILKLFNVSDTQMNEIL